MTIEEMHWVNKLPVSTTVENLQDIYEGFFKSMQRSAFLHFVDYGLRERRYHCGLVFHFVGLVRVVCIVTTMN